MRRLSEGMLWEGMSLALISAKDHFEVGERAAVNCKYGIATSLMILSAEESTKSMGLLGYALTEKYDDRFIKPLFTSHRAKHDAAKAVMAMIRFMEITAETIHSVQSDPTIPETQKPAVFVERMTKRAKENVDGNKDDFGDLAFWQHAANELKNRGFYVDWCDGKWQSPGSMDEATYQDVRTRAESLIKVMNALIEQGGIAQVREAIANVRQEMPKAT